MKKLLLSILLFTGLSFSQQSVETVKIMWEPPTRVAYTYYKFVINANGGDNFWAGVSEIIFRTVPGGIQTAINGSTGIASCSFQENGNAFDNNTTNWWMWQLTLYGFPQWTKFHYNTAVLICEYRVFAPSVAARAPTAWVLQASNDNVTWTIIDSRSNINWTTEYQGQTFTIP